MRATSRAVLAVLAASVGAAIGVPGNASAEAAWPTKQPINVVVPFGPGGGADLMARLVTDSMAAALGQTFIIENKPGASGQIGDGYASRRPPDGYNILGDGSTFMINPHLYPKAPYSVASFTCLGIIAKFPEILAVTPSFQARSIQQLITLAKAAPQGISVASVGVGSSQDLAARVFMQRTQARLAFIPYNGGGAAMVDVMGGHVPLLFGNGASTISHVRNGGLRALAITGEARLAALPDTPTLDEVGVTGVDLYEWNALFIPVGAPPAIVDKLADALAHALATPEVRKRIADLGGVQVAGGHAGAQGFIDQQSAFVAKIIRETGVHID